MHAQRLMQTVGHMKGLGPLQVRGQAVSHSLKTMFGPQLVEVTVGRAVVRVVAGHDGSRTHGPSGLLWSNSTCPSAHAQRLTHCLVQVSMTSALQARGQAVSQDLNTMFTPQVWVVEGLAVSVEAVVVGVGLVSVLAVVEGHAVSGMQRAPVAFEE